MRKWLSPRRLVRLALKIAFALLASVYFLIVRSFLVLLSLYVILYFLSGTSWFKTTVQDLIAEGVPGAITVGTVQWGPDPFQVTIAHGRIIDDHGAEVAHVPATSVEMDWLPTLGGLFRRAVDSDAPITIYASRATVTRPWSWVEVREDGSVGIHATFDAPRAAPRKPGDPLPPKLDIHLAEVVMRDSHGRVSTEHFDVLWEDLDLRGDFHIVDTPGTAYFDIPRATLGRVDVELKPHLKPAGLGELGRTEIAIRDLEVRLFRWRGSRFDFLRGNGAVDGDGRISLSGGVETDPDKTLLAGTVMLDLAPQSTLLSEMTGRVIEGPGRFHGKVSTDLSSWFATDMRVASPELHILDFPLYGAELTFAVEPNIRPDGTVEHRIDLSELAASVFGGRVSVTSASYSALADSVDPIRPNATTHHFDATLALEAVDPWQLFGSSLFGIADLNLPFLQGSLDGTCRLDGVLDDGTGHTAVQLNTEGLTMTWAGAASLPLDERYRLSGGLRYTRAPPGSEGDTTHLGVVERVDIDDLRLTSGGDWMRADGFVDLADGALSLGASVRIGELSRFLAPFDVRDVGGRFRLLDGRVGGTIMNPTVRGQVRWTRAKVGTEPVGEISGHVSLADGLLQVHDLASKTPWGSVSAAGRLRLYHDDVERWDAAMPFTISRLRISQLALHKLIPSLDLKTTLTLRETRPISGELARPVDSLTGEVRVEAQNLALFGERARRFTGLVRATRSQLVLDRAKLVLCRGAESSVCRRGGPVIEAGLAMAKRFGRGAPKIDAHLETRDMPLSAIRAIRRAAPLDGRLSANLKIDGTTAAPLFFGTVEIGDFGVDELRLGDARLELTWGSGGETVVTSTRFFDGMALEEGRLSLENGRLKAHAEATARRLAVFSRLIPSLRNRTLDIVASGKVQLDLAPGTSKPWRLAVDAPAGEATVSLHEGRVEFTNATPVHYEQDQDGLRVPDPITLRSGGGRDLALCGSLRRGELAIDVSGTVGAELIKPLQATRDAFSVVSGALEVAEDPGLDPREHCFDANDKAVLRIRGSLEAPSARGRLTTRGLRLMPRNFGRSIELADGGILELSTAKDGRQLVTIPSSERLRGELEDGTFGLWGTLAFEGLVFEDADLRLKGTDIFWASSGEWNLTFNPDLSLTVRDFDKPGVRNLALGGDVVIIDGTYYKSFDQFARAFGSVTGAPSGESYSQPITEQLPWLKDLTLKLDVKSADFDVRSPFPLGSADLDVRIDVQVRGTLDNPQVFNRIDLLAGGTFSYNVFQREFEVVSGYLDFAGDPLTPRIDVRAQTEIEYLERVTSSSRVAEEKQVIVTVEITGRLPDELQIRMYGTPGGFDQADLQSLLLTGKPLDEDALAREDSLFRFDVGQFVNALLAAPFIEAQVGVTQEGLFDAELVTKFGRDLRLRTRAVQEADDSTRLSARFQFRISDQVMLEGSVDRTTGSTATAHEQYQARIKYRIRLD